MTDLLFQPSPARDPNNFEVIADDWIVGRIVLSDASPDERPWMWSLGGRHAGVREVLASRLITSAQTGGFRLLHDGLWQTNRRTRKL